MRFRWQNLNDSQPRKRQFHGRCWLYIGKRYSNLYRGGAGGGDDSQVTVDADPAPRMTAQDARLFGIAFEAWLSARREGGAA